MISSVLKAQPQQRTPRFQPVASHRRRVGIVGGGIAGLVVAYRRMLAGDDVTLFESDGRLGGQLWTDVRDGFVVEHGAEGFAPGSEAVRALASELGVVDRIVGQRAHRAYGFGGRSLELLEAGEAPARLGLRAPHGQAGRGIASFRGGMGELVHALAAKIRGPVKVRLNDRIWQILPAGSAWELVAGSLARVRVDSLVLATGSRVAGDLLRRSTGESTGLEQATALSTVTVSLAYERSSVGADLGASGFVVLDSASLDGCRACTFSSSKLPDRAPDGHVLLRLFFRASEPELETMADAAWVSRGREVLRRVLGVHSDPERRWVDRWPDAMAVVDAEQRRRVAAVERRLARRGILLAGGAFHGPGIEGAVRSGEAAAAALAAVACAR
jgi:oxygen-dependent protoporphyrinogen oxidase